VGALVSGELVNKTAVKCAVGDSRLEPTVRSNKSLQQKLGGFSTIAEGLDYAARGETGYNFYSSRGALAHVLTYKLLREKAIVTARKLVSTGLQHGERVGIVAETAPEFLIAFYACQYAGLVPCPMPYSMYIGGRESYVARVAGMLRAAGASAVVTTRDLHDQISEGASHAGVRNVLTHEEIEALPEAKTPLKGFSGGDVAYIQYSSGSTSEPKGVLITQRSIMANAEAILRHGLSVTKDDRAFSWLPLYHDMGLVGFCISPMVGQVSVDYLATTAFARRPALWLRLMSQNRTTISYSPTFGYELASRRINGEAATLDLSSLRVAGIGGDMVRPEVLNKFFETMRVAGFDSKAFLPSYGMAEATLAVSFSKIDEPLRTDTIAADRMKSDRIAVPVDAARNAGNARSFVICGKAIPGHELVVRDDEGIALSERRIGQIFIKGPSLMAGYYNRSEDTALTIGKDGFLDTGDMGYRLGDEIVITGRAKDLILHNGRNIWPQDIEWAAEKIAPLKGGDVAAFAVEGTDGDDEVVVLVECRLNNQEEREELRRQVAKTVHQSAGVDCSIILVPPRSLPFTSSGKLSRAGARQRYLSGEIAEAVVSPSSAFLQAAQ
jgi:fatty-acyl-CoA synthase